MLLSDTTTYLTGDSFKELLSCKDELVNLNGFELAAHFSDNKEDVLNFGNYKYFHLWSAILIKNGRNIKNELDKFLEKSNLLQDSSYNKMKPIQNIFTEIMLFQKAIRSYENDCYDFINSYAASDINQKSSEIFAISNVLIEINKTYDRVFTQTRQKLASISNARVSIASLLLSIVAIGIAIVSIYHSNA
ncbi:MAG: hypothetical protein COB67_05885 [SAR324 cluster bacterium]|uniref:Uncharacterized protein n=1 Tax=SAR324 cluster bacterium TaxID=2024889 RepID=A0A2A4T4S5_9DELT|nr:MAG: hypothetical protein COB67_05885 [SAR324 cluster bacterium]